MAAEPEIRVPNRNKRGERTRAELLDAAWRIVDRMSLVELLSGLTPNAVASEAGVTTGAVRHHFDDTEQLVRAMVDAHIENIHWQNIAQVSSLVTSGRPIDATVVRAAAQAFWATQSNPGEWDRLRRRALVSSRSAQTTFSSGEELRDLVVDGYWQVFLGMSAPVLEQALQAIDRTCIPPFRPDDLLRLLSAIVDGLMAQSMLQPEVIDEQLFANVVAGLFATLTTPAARDASLADLEADLRGPHVLAGVKDGARIQELAIAAIDVFDRNVDDITFSQIAAATGTPIEVLLGLYRTVRRMAAVAFAKVVPRIEESAARHRTRDPMRALADTICDIARMARDHPHVARALLLERSEQTMTPPEDRGWEEGTTCDIRVVVPIADGVMGALAAVPGLEWAEIPVLAADMVDLALLFGGTRREMSPADVASVALRLLPGAGSAARPEREAEVSSQK